MSAYLVIGARGKSGQYVVSELLARGASVRAGSRYPEGVNIKGAEAVRFEWDDERTWDGALLHVDGVYLIKPESHDVVAIVERFIAKMKDFSVRRLVVLSECAAETRAEHLPERQVELLVESSDLDWTILRPNWMMQDIVDDGFFGALVRDYRMIAMSTGGSALAWIDAHDIGEVAAQALVNGDAIRECVYLTGPESLTLTKLAERISAYTSDAIVAIEESVDDAEARMRADGVDDEFIRYISRISETIIAGDIADVSDGVERIAGHPPRSIDAFLAENADLLRGSTEVSSQPVSEDEVSITRNNEALFRRLVAAWSGNDLDDLLDCYSDNMVYVDMPFPDQPVEGKHSFRTHMERYNGLFAGGQVEVEVQTAVASSTNVAGELHTRALYVGPGAPDGGVPVSWYATLVVAIENGKVVSEHAYYDPATFNNAVARAHS